MLYFFLVFKQVEGAILVKELVVLLQIADTLFRQHFQAALHLAHGIPQSVGGQLGFGDDRHIEMGYAFIDAQFQALGVNQDQPHLLRRGFVEDGHDHGIDSHALAGAG